MSSSFTNNTATATQPGIHRLHCAGSPRFAEPRIARVAAGDGNSAAWAQALAAFEPQVLTTISGDFCVGMTRPDGSTFLAVDRFAIRSLCYRLQDGVLSFSERANELADAHDQIEAQAIFDYLYFHAIPSPRTIYQGVVRLPPGHYALFRDGKLLVAPYWQPNFQEPHDVDFNSLRDEFRQCLRDSVASQLGSGRTGCFLSGGTDSSTVAGMLGEVTGAPAPTFSIGFDAAGYDEMEFSRIAARHFGTEHHEYYITPDDLVRSIADVAASYDQPFGNSSVLPTYYCAKLAKEAGIGRILGGDGGDELFGGNTRYAKQLVFGLYGRVPAILRTGVLEPGLVGNPLAQRLPLIRKAASYVTQARTPMPDRMQGYNMLMRLGLDSMLSPAFLARIDANAPVLHQRGVYQATNTPNLLNRMLAFDWRYTLGEIDLPKVVGATRLAGIPVGFPMLDDRLVDFSTRLPANFKVRRLKLRWFFKEALRGFLPDAILTKKKQGFGLPFGVWVAQHAPLMNLASDSLRSFDTRGVLRPGFAEELLTRHLPAHPGYYGETVWIIMMMEQWMRRHCPDYRFS